MRRGRSLFKKPQPRPCLAFFKAQGGRGIFAFVVALAIVCQVSYHAKLVYSPTPSLPYRLFLSLNHVTPKKGQYTCIDNPWYGGRVIKKIIGGAGDTLFYDGYGALWIEPGSSRGLAPTGRLRVGIPQKKSKEGRLLTPIQPGVIPEGRVFLAGEHGRSFDSRYGEVGLVPEKDLKGCLLPLL